jgi:hypothetical protein
MFANFMRQAIGNVNAPAEFHNPPDNFIGILADAKNLPGGQRNHGVGRNVDMFNQTISAELR